MSNRSWFGLLLFFLWFTAIIFPVALLAECTIKVSVDKGCVPQPVFFKVEITGLPAGVKPVSYSWNFKDNSTTAQDSITHIYYTKGKFLPSVIVTFSDGSTCQVTLPKPIQIFDNPKAFFSLPDSVLMLCRPGDFFCFKNGSKRGAEGAPIDKWVWNFGDGVLSKEENPCHDFLQEGTFLISLEVTDTNGCKGFIQRNVTIKFVPPTKQPFANFTAKYNVKCGETFTDVTFTNLTDTAGINITRFAWDFKDGSKPDTCNLTNNTCQAKWDNFVHRYSKPGIFNPKLYIENKYGCKDSFTFYSVELDDFKLDVQLSDSVLCYANSNSVSFSIPYTKRAKEVSWNFGDPEAGEANISKGFTSGHRYTKPGIYTVYANVIFDSCQMDTVLCKKVKIYGPVAKIMRDTAIDRLPKLPLVYKIPKAEYPVYFDSCTPYTPYWKYEKITVKNGDTTFGSACDPDINYINKGISYNCQKQTETLKIPVYTRKILGTKDLSYMGYADYYWFPGDKYPDTPVYRYNEFIDRPLVWNDTDLYSIRCGPPKLVRFTNFSWKYRGYDANDNFPPGSPYSCLPTYNPSYPYASDSLDYFWDFGEGDSGTSTTQNPNIRSKYSTEKVPSHLFLDSGCFFVKLKVKDKITGCESEDEIKIVVEKADAGWAAEYDTIKNMTFDIQKRLPPGFPRRGFILEGKPCTGCKQTINVDETLPGCRTRDYQFVFDSANMVIYKDCGGIIDSSRYTYDWNKDFQGGSVLYRDSGWKTIGVVVYNNYYCTDTVWYHNYKYFHTLDPEISPDRFTGCVDDTFKLYLKNPKQYGIKLVTFNYKYVYGKGFDTLLLPPDTLRYKIIKNNHNETDTVTSTTHNPTLDIVDKDSFSFLKDTVYKVLDKPGFIKVYAKIYNRFGCIDSSITVFSTGHFSNFSVPNRVVCVSDSVKFSPQVFYNLLNDVDKRPFWSNPVGVRNGRKPAIEEKIKWDFNGDGIIDDTTFSPVFIYNKVGNYTVRLYTKDSSGCDWQMFEKKDYIKAIDIKADFTVDSPGFTRFCHPQFFQFRDKSRVIDSFSNLFPKEQIAAWMWDFGDGSQPILIDKKDSARKDAGYVYLHNGEYNVTLRAFTSTSTGAENGGCVAEVTKKIVIEGPVPQFKIIGDTIGCVPFTLKVLDLSKKARFRDWRLGDGTIVSSAGNDTVLLTYNKVGVFCPSLIAADSIRDFNNNISYCSDTFPYRKCLFQVNVIPHPKVALKHSDTIICEGDNFTFTDNSDSLFKFWQIDFGDGGQQTFTVKPQGRHKYNKKGIYSLSYKGAGYYCPDSLVRKIHVIDVLADFYIDTTRIDTPYFWFVNTSRNGKHFNWFFDDGSEMQYADNLDAIRHKFQRQGELNVCLVAMNEKFCPDTICKKLSLEAYVRVPNVFTPADKNGFNDKYIIDIKGELKYELDIFNRWGQKVFRSETKYNLWDGSLFNDGSTQCPAGTYYYIFNYQLIGEEPKQKQGTITLIR